MQVYCQKLQRNGTRLARKPLAGELGERIYQHISQEAWDLWLQQQTMLLNEYRLLSFEPETQTFMREQMEKFLFEGSEVAPEEYRPSD